MLIAKLWDVAVEDLEVMQDLLELLKHIVTDSASAQKTFCLQVNTTLLQPLSTSSAFTDLLAVHTLHQLGIRTLHVKHHCLRRMLAKLNVSDGCRACQSASLHC